MVKKIGNNLFKNFIKISFIISLLIISFGIICSDDVSIKLMALSRQNYLLDTTSVGIPFSIQISIDSKNQILQKPELQGLENFEVLEVIPGYSQITIGGKTNYEQKYLYLVKATKTGIFKVGPVKITVNGKEIVSQILTIKVVEPKKDTSFIDTEAKYDLIVKRKNVYIGEKISFTLSFGFDNSKSIKLQAIQDPEMAGIKGLKLKGPFSKEELINNKSFQMLQWHGEFYSTSTGVLSIPPLKATYRIGFQLYDIFSQTVKINIKELPKFNQPINAIGKFKDFKLTLEKEKITNDQAVILKLSLHGEGDLENIAAPKLDLPVNLRSYSGSKKIEDNSIIFEYVIQAELPDSYKIPSQKFTYFDIEKKKYFTLESNEVELVVLPSSKPKIASPYQDITILKIKTEEKQKNYKFPQIPDLLFILLLIIPIILILLKNLSSILINNKFFINLKNKLRFIKFKRLLNKAKQKKDIESIYQILKKAISAKFDLSDDITNREIDIIFYKYGLQKDMIDNWNIFINQLNEPFFYKNKNNLDIENLFKQAYYWLNIVKRIKI